MKTAKRIMLMLSITALLCCLLSVAASPKAMWQMIRMP